MSFLYGVGALFAAFLIIAVFRSLMNRPGIRWDPEAYAASDVVSLSFTGLIAFGVVSIVSAVARGHFPAVLIELAVALAALAGACAVTWILLRRALPAAAASGAAPGSPSGTTPTRPGRTPPSPQPKAPAGSRKRAA